MFTMSLKKNKMYDIFIKLEMILRYVRIRINGVTDGVSRDEKTLKW